MLLYAYTNAALGQVLMNYVALLWVEVGQPWFEISLTLFQQGVNRCYNVDVISKHCF
jgi:hypothetical protein